MKRKKVRLLMDLKSHYSPHHRDESLLFGLVPFLKIHLAIILCYDGSDISSDIICCVFHVVLSFVRVLHHRHAPMPPDALAFLPAWTFRIFGRLFGFGRRRAFHLFFMFPVLHNFVLYAETKTLSIRDFFFRR